MRNPVTMFFLVLPLGILQYTAAWQGTWDLNLVIRDCTTHDTLSVSVLTDTLCSEEALNQGLNCTGTVTDTDFDFTCTQGFSLFPGCMGTNTLHGVGSRTGDAYSSNVTLTTTFSGDCSFPPSCTEQVITAVRTGPAPAGCGTPVEASTWGGIKARFGE